MKSDSIGIIDWGIGGLSVYKELRRQHKSDDYIYFSDSGFTPYGKTKKPELIKRLNKVIQFFRNQKISKVIIACNAASTVLNDLQKKNPDMQLHGMLEAGRKAILKTKKKSILVLGGKRTIQSQYFQSHFQNSKIKLQAAIAQPLSALIEKGNHQGDVFKNEVLKIKKKSLQKPDVILLACTHYPAAENIFQHVFPESLILDPAVELVKSMKLKLKSKKSASFFTTGSVNQSKLAAQKAFDLHIKRFDKVNLK